MPAIRRLVKSADGLWIPQWPKAPNEVEGYGIGWLQILGPNDFIVAHNFIVEGTGIVQMSGTHTRSMSVWWGTGGVINTTCDVIHEITSDNGRRLSQTMRLHIVKK